MAPPGRCEVDVYDVTKRNFWQITSKTRINEHQSYGTRCGSTIDGVAYLNLELQDTNSPYILQYEPVIISSDIYSCIFGINSEKHFWR